MNAQILVDSQIIEENGFIEAACEQASQTRTPGVIAVDHPLHYAVGKLVEQDFEDPGGRLPWSDITAGRKQAVSSLGARLAS